ncbi:hypothetical protein BJ912DRAFT_1044338 [Pholiota molesta]|nr:hypothetical protein BJ912DRAFT_1044338 [Pholiota molesta]
MICQSSGTNGPGCARDSEVQIRTIHTTRNFINERRTILSSGGPPLLSKLDAHSLYTICAIAKSLTSRKGTTLSNVNTSLRRMSTGYLQQWRNQYISKARLLEDDATFMLLMRCCSPPSPAAARFKKVNRRTVNVKVV